MAAVLRSPQSKSCYDKLRRMILHGQLTAGSRLIEEKWARCLDVSRGALREASALLAHEGLLEAGPRGGLFIPQPDNAVLDEVLEVRLALEVGSLWALELRDGGLTVDLQPLRHTCAVMSQLLESGYEFGFIEADRHFHEQLVALSGNARMQRTYRQAPLPLFPIAEQDDTRRRENMRRTVEEHVMLTELLEAGRISDAISLLRKHLLVDHRTSKAAAAYAAGRMRVLEVAPAKNGN